MPPLFSTSRNFDNFSELKVKNTYNFYSKTHQKLVSTLKNQEDILDRYIFEEEKDKLESLV